MLEKLKNLGEASKSFLLYIVTPVVFIAGYIYYLITQNQELKFQARQGKADQKVDELFEEAQRAKEKSDNAEKNYRDVVSEYLNQHGIGPDGKDKS